ncbi:hypothetical protein AB0869_15535 [Micromonospora vinacea]|uniref:hypothetical protein n=1 Tax=Micromonospora vinacea TaxID=709878 RepID=UPI0034546ED4
MTDTVELLDAQNPATPEAAAPETGPAATDLMIHTAATEEMLVAAWQATNGSDDTPAWLSRVATLLAAGYGPMPATPTDETAHHLLTAAVAAAKATAQAAVVEANARQLAHDEFSNDSLIRRTNPAQPARDPRPACPPAVDARPLEPDLHLLVPHLRPFCVCRPARRSARPLRLAGRAGIAPWRAATAHQWRKHDHQDTSPHHQAT